MDAFSLSLISAMEDVEEDFHGSPMKISSPTVDSPTRLTIPTLERMEPARLESQTLPRLPTGLLLALMSLRS
jgi:hypothetical protein